MLLYYVIHTNFDDFSIFFVLLFAQPGRSSIRSAFHFRYKMTGYECISVYGFRVVGLV